MSDSNDNIPITEFGNFIGDYYKQFAVMGIFGTITIFTMSEWPKDGSKFAQEMAAVASTAMFAFVALWLSIMALRELSAKKGERLPGFAEFGYATVIISTLILGLAVFSVAEIFTTAIQLFFELTVSVFLVTVYVFAIPSSTEQLTEDLFNETEPMAFSLISIYAGTMVFYNFFTKATFYGILYELDMGNFILLHIAIGSLLFAFLIQEGVLGAIQLILWVAEAIKEYPDIPQRSNWKSWPIRSLFFLSSVPFIILTLWVAREANAVVGTNYGYYRILFLAWREFILFHWLGLSIAVIGISILHTKYPKWQIYSRPTAFTLPIITFLIAIIDLFYLLPQTVHVIPI